MRNLHKLKAVNFIKHLLIFKMLINLSEMVVLIAIALQITSISHLQQFTSMDKGVLNIYLFDH